MKLSRLPYLLYLSFFPFLLHGQDGHYWTEQYGAHSTLLGGVVLGSVDDLGALYYNPARLALIKDPSFIISARVYQLQKTVIEDALGNDLDLTESDIGKAPNMLAGSFSLGKLERHKFGYSLLTRYESDLEFLIRTNREGDIIDGIPGEELFIGEVNWSKSLREEWLGLSWSFQAWPKVSVGLTHFFSLRRQESLFKIQLQALSVNDEISFLARNRQKDFNSYSMLWKLGLAFDLKPVTAGLAITIPKVHLGGKGTFLFEDFFSGIKANNNAREDLFLTSLQDGLDVQHRSPLSIGAGAGLSLGKSKLHASVEWFSGIPQYTIMRSAPFIGQSNGDTIATQLVEKLESVINYGIGFELFLNDKLSAYGSFATDHSAVNSSINRFVEFASKSNNSIIRADLFHLVGGGVCRVKKVDFTVGGAFSFAEQEILRPVDLPEEDGDIIFSSGQTSTVKWRRWRLIFGFSFPLAKDNEQ